MKADAARRGPFTTALLDRPIVRAGAVERRIPYPRLDTEFYDSVLANRSSEPVARTEVPPDSGRAVTVEAGQIARVVGPDGPQIADVCFFNAHDPVEHLWANQTLNREGAHLSLGSRLWSTMPAFRPLMTTVADTVPSHDWERGARHHIILGAHCNRWMWLLATGRDHHPNCYDQLCAAVTSVGLDTHLVHDNLNLFQKTRIDGATGHYVTEGSDARPGDFVEFYAETDVIMALSTCPLGSGQFPAESGRRDPKRLVVDVFDTGVPPRPFSYR